MFLEIEIIRRQRSVINRRKSQLKRKLTLTSRANTGHDSRSQGKSQGGKSQGGKSRDQKSRRSFKSSRKSGKVVDRKSRVLEINQKLQNQARQKVSVLSNET